MRLIALMWYSLLLIGIALSFYADTVDSRNIDAIGILLIISGGVALAIVSVVIVFQKPESKNGNKKQTP